MTRTRGLVATISFVVAMTGTGGEIGLLGTGNGREASAAPQQHGRNRGKAAKPSKKAAKGQKARGVAVPKGLLVADDPSLPLGAAWQRQVQRFLGQSRPDLGAFVALDPATGSVIASAEYSARPAKVAHPATAAAFPAASVFKIVTAAALLEAGDVKPGVVTCYHGGSHDLVEDNLVDSPKRDRACRSLTAAFAHSTNAVFGKLAVKYLDAETLLQFAERLGFNQNLKLGELEARSVAEKPSGKLALARMAAGFSHTRMSPVQAAWMASVIANGGMAPRDGRTGTDGIRILKGTTTSALKAMMVSASYDGTGRRHLSAIRGGRVAMKTGTLSSRNGSNLLNTWMVGFFPADRPEFAFAAVIASPGGPVKAGHLTRFAIETWQRLKASRAGRS